MSGVRRWGGLALAALAAACGAPATNGADAYPPGPYGLAVGATLPDLAFSGVAPSGAPATLALHDFMSAGPPRLLVIQESGGAWCGTCRYSAEHFDDVLGSLRARVDRLDLIVTNRDNAPASPDEDARSWQNARAPGVAVGVDAGFELGAVRGGALPLVVVVNAATLRVVDALSNPSPTELRGHVASALATLDGSEPAPMPKEALVDGLFHENEWDLFIAMAQPPGAPPPDPTNEVADSPAARRLGKALFFDAGLSPSGQVSCASCHDPEQHLSDGRPQGLGVALGDRRTPSIALSAHARWQMWDGRADTLWAQALLPFENTREMASSRVFVGRRVLEQHRDEYLAAFPDAVLPDASTWPAAGRPGLPAYDALSAADQDGITQIFVRAGKAIAAYERTFRVRPTRFDAYVAGDFDALSDDEKYGLVVFARSGCPQCHWGPRLTDDAFHVTRTGTGRQDGAPDPGRQDGFAAWVASEFRADGRWSAAPTSRPQDASDLALGQFKTPSLRGVAELSYFGHGGADAALSDVTAAYGLGGLPPDDPSCAGQREPWLVPFGETAQWGLVPFLNTLTATPGEDRVPAR